MGTRKDAITLLVRHGVASAESFLLLACGSPEFWPSVYQAKCERLRRRSFAAGDATLYLTARDGIRDFGWVERRGEGGRQYLCAHLQARIGLDNGGMLVNANQLLRRHLIGVKPAGNRTP